MSYDPKKDFMALFNTTPNGVRGARAPTLDVVLATMARAGLFKLAVQGTAPVANQAATAWLLPAVPSWSAEGSLFLWNPVTLGYEPATPALFYKLLQAG